PIYLDKSQTLNIVLRKDHPDSFNLIVYYQIISPGLFYYISEQNYPSVFDFIGEEYFFYPKDVPIRALRVLKPDNMLVFKDLHNNYTGQSYVNLVFIEKDAFKQRESIRNENITMTVFVPDSLANDSAINAKLDKLYTRVNKVAAMTTTHRDINMLLINWRDEQRRVAAGKGFGNLFVCDIKFNPQSMLHETIHLLFDNKIDHSSGGGYFVGESVIEWLAAYFSDGLKGIDTDVIATNNEGNLYDIIANHGSTFRLVYTIGPAIIQKIAKQVGEERMAQALIAFLKETDDGQFRSYEDFILFMQHHLPKRAITRMDRMVRGFAK
ncbi:MAG: hypothetical protein LBM62_07460, partial [Mediterranea sp.]|nr:hypothetical protein [Mediterranea sp.]